MKCFAPLFLLVATLVVVVAPFALAATASPPTQASSDRSPFAPLATAVSTITGMAISPLLGTGAFGAYKWTMAKDGAARAALPWYAQPKFWVPALLLVLVCAAKDAFGTVLPPGFKKPFDVLETLENKVTGLVAAGAVVPFTMDMFSKLLLGKSAAAGAAIVPGGLAMIQVAGVDFSWLLDVLTVPFGVAVFALVWMASHAINVLILLSPWGAIDAALKAGRTALLGLLTVSATMNPWLGAILSLVVIIIAYFISGWAFRLTIFGTQFCWEFLTLRRKRFVPAENNNAMFAGANMPGVPIRTYGRLVARKDSGLEFVYRPWLLLPVRVATVPAEVSAMAIGKGLFFSDIVDAERTLFSLPPRYYEHEEEVARAYGMAGGVHPAGLRKAWGEMRELVGGRATKPYPA